MDFSILFISTQAHVAVLYTYIVVTVIFYYNSLRSKGPPMTETSHLKWYQKKHSYLLKRWVNEQ